MKTITKDAFYRGFTSRAISSLDTQVVLRRIYEYLHEYLPINTLSFTLYDHTCESIKIANIVGDAYLYSSKDEYDMSKSKNVVRDDPASLLNYEIALPHDLWLKLVDYAWANRNRATNTSEFTDAFCLQITELNKTLDTSSLSISIHRDRILLGSLNLTANGKKAYNASHLELLDTVVETCSIVMSNSHKFKKLVNDNVELTDYTRFLSNELFASKTDKIIGSHSGLKNVMNMVRQVAQKNSPVLILGETGTGKEMIANAIHLSSQVKEGPFIKVNCGAIPENLIDSELFGHEKGAFTGAVTEKKGRFERANGGTIFLDEIGELPLQVQTRLLRVLQFNEIERVGSSKTTKINIRVIAATHRNLEQMVSMNQFREDLWFRLNIFPITIPPLRLRKDDIPDLVKYFVEIKSSSLNIKPTPQVDPESFARLAQCSWKGNIRELQNLVERELIMYQGGLLAFKCNKATTTSNITAETCAIDLTLDEVVSSHIRTILDITNGKVYGKGGAAERLGINASTLRSRMDKLGIEYGREKHIGFENV